LLAIAALPVQLPYSLVLEACLLVCLVAECIALSTLLRRKGSDPLLTVVSSLGGGRNCELNQYLVGAESYTFPANTYGILPAVINLAQQKT